MLLYKGSTESFLSEIDHHTIAERLEEEWRRYFFYRANASEISSWQNSLTALAGQIRYSGLHDNGIILEMQMPMSSARLDALITGTDDAGSANGVIIELKQWSHVQPSPIPDCVATVVNRRERDMAHPSLQADSYRQYLEDTHSAFQGPVSLSACSWLHNLRRESDRVLKDPRFNEIVERAPLFTGRDADAFSEYLNSLIGVGHGEPILTVIEESKYVASKQLLAHVAEIVRGVDHYVLLDDQIVAHNTIVEHAKKSHKSADHGVLVVRGGPGTGKSLIALKALGELAGLNINAQYVTGSRAFTENLRKLVGRRASSQFRYTNNYTDATQGEIDVLIVDEAHRVRESGNTWRTPKHKRSQRHQLEELMSAARRTIFFIDDFQVVRPGEIGSTGLFREMAGSLGYSYRELELNTQFRCSGSNNYLQWLDETLGIIPATGCTLDNGFDFRIVPDVHELDRMIRGFAEQGFTARMTAGFCWKWSAPRTDGSLVDDVVIGDFRRPWDAKADAGRLAPGIPSASFWATDPGGLDQIGCIYNAQGFEFDYVGVIFGPDMRFDPDTGTWIGDKAASCDSFVKSRSKDQFLQYVRNAYRVLMTRGLKGCYVHFMDGATQSFFEERFRGRAY